MKSFLPFFKSIAKIVSIFMVLRDEIILFEYFTAMSSIKENYNKKIFIEAQNLSNLLIYYFLKDKDLKKIHVIRNSTLSNFKDYRIQYHFVNEDSSQNKVLKLLDTGHMIVIAPESDQINSKIIKKLNKKFNLLNSSYNIHKLFSSKKKLMKY